MRDKMPRLLCYTKLDRRELRDGAPLWVAIVSGSTGQGGDGVVISGMAFAQETDEGLKLADAIGPGDKFLFGATNVLHLNVERELWGLDAVPDAVAAAWMKFKQMGKLNA